MLEGLALFTALLQSLFGFLASFIDGRSPLLCTFGLDLFFNFQADRPDRYFRKGCGFCVNRYMGLDRRIVSPCSFQP